MSPPPVVSVGRRQRSSHAVARRRTVVRRRRTVLAGVCVGVLAVVVVLALPTFRKAVNEFTLPLAYQDVIREQAVDKHLDPALIAGVIYAETKFDPRPSAAGAQGPMQLMPQTAEFLAHRSGATSFTLSDLATPRVNIAYGSYYLRYLLDEYGGKIVPALAAYNAGEANVSRWLERSRRHRLELREIPFPETRAYVSRVLQAQHDYRHSYATQLGYR
ncbi:MAG: lytic transglycosylase domain-containing protein [Solirubrobacterales bacterium]|nr:lytic transglycosylase domain-containing protein [Solirubrobacterales bacterium]